jgi:hypothetical protein
MAPALDEPRTDRGRPAKVPIFVGITGKRDLKGQDAYVRGCLEAAFAMLDRELPHVPKVLLSGLAEGTDTIAAELALARADWLVAAILPMARQVYLEDFPDEPPVAVSDDSAASAAPSPRRTIEALLAHSRVKVRALAHLKNEQTGQPYPTGQLTNHAGLANDLRPAHYEQLGLWLAENATVLIAVMPADEKPDRLGGTARVVDYRLTGRPDRAAREVFRGSAEICAPRPLDQGRLGPLWLIDAPTAAEGSVAPADLFTIWPADPRHDSAKDRGGLAERMRASLTLARGFDGLARRMAPVPGAFRWPANPPQPNDMLGILRHEITRIQRLRKTWLTASTYSLAVLFCAAVLLLDLHIEQGAAGSWAAMALVLYFAAVFAAGTIHFLVDWRRWQRIAEDYRAVNEALRVQLAWWEAGLSGPEYRADRHYLGSVHGPILYSRHAVRGIVEWTRLCCLPQEPSISWHQVHGPRDSWVAAQISYFREHARRRQRAVDVVRVASWVLFLVALFLAFMLFGYARGAKVLGDTPAAIVAAVRFPLGLAMAAAGIWWLWRQRTSRPGSLHWRLAATVVAAGIALALAPVLPALAADVVRGIEDKVQYVAAMLVVLLSATAGAVRFVADKLAWEAEANRYEDALTAFERAADELADADRAVADGESSAESALAYKQRIVVDLGQEALEENEYWLRAHRERPIEQAIGG